MTDSAIGHSTVTSPIIGHPENNICDDAVQMLSPNMDRGSNFRNYNVHYIISTIYYFITFLNCLIIVMNTVLIGAMRGQLNPNKSQCSSLGSDREENFESYGENDVGIDGDDK